MNLGSLVPVAALGDTGPIAVAGVSVESFGAVSIAVLAVGTLAGLGAVGRLSGGLRSGGSTGTENRTGEDSAIETLKDRYVAGEVDGLEFERRLETLYEDAAQEDRERTAQREQAADTAGDPADGEPSPGSRPATEETHQSSRGTCGPEKQSSKRSKRRRGGASGRRGCR